MPIDDIPDLKSHGNDAVFFGALRRRSAHGFMSRGVEWMSCGVDRFEAMTGERLEQLFFDHQHAVDHRLRIKRCGIDVRETRDVIDGVEQAANQVSLRTPSRFLSFFRRATTKVVILSGRAQKAVVEQIVGACDVCVQRFKLRG